MPVPSVTTTTTPPFPRPAPNRISAIPAASASLRTTMSRMSRSANRAAASVPSQERRRFAALPITPPRTMPGNVMPIGPSPPTRSTTVATASATDLGDGREGVSMRVRSPSKAPVARSTRPPLIPLPPISIPTREAEAGSSALPPAGLRRSSFTGVAALSTTGMPGRTIAGRFRAVALSRVKDLSQVHRSSPSAKSNVTPDPTKAERAAM